MNCESTVINPGSCRYILLFLVMKKNIFTCKDIHVGRGYIFLLQEKITTSGACGRIK